MTARLDDLAIVDLGRTLDGLLVVDLGPAVAGPDASMMLGDLGSLRHRNAETHSLTTVRTPI
jgi:hypothetical protein